MAWYDDLDFDEDIGGAFDMGGFDIGDVGGAFDMGGFDIGNLDLAGAFDLGGFDISDLAGSFDLGGFNIGNLDLGGAFDIGGLGDIDLSDTGAFDLGGYDIGDVAGAFDMGGYDIGGLDLGGAFDQGGFDVDLSDTGAFDIGGYDVGGLDLAGAFDQEGLGGVDLSRAGTFDTEGFGGVDLSRPGAFDTEGFGEVFPEGLSYDPGEGYGTGVLPGAAERDATEDVRQFFGDTSGQSQIPDWARQGVDAGTIRPNYDGTYTQIFDDGSAQTLDYRGNVVETTTRDGITYDTSGRITSGSRTGELVSQSDIKGTDIKSEDIKTKTVDDKKTTDDKKKTDDKKDDKSIFDDLKKLIGGGKDNAALIALLGGLLGLLGRDKGGATGGGYKGGIPKYTAIRGPAVSPTAGGRRAGGAGIGSLTGGVSYTKAAQGGLMGLAGGGRPARYLRGGTDGMADKIKTDIDGKQPARLSHGEFVIPADVVSHLGNGNSDAGADVLYDMMDKVRKARTGTTKQGKQINSRKMLPA